MASSKSAAPDVVIVGGGPVGCVAALAFARRGAQVVLLEARSGVVRRLAGEWLHPRGVQVLERLGAGDLFAAPERGRGHGLIVLPEDGSAPIVLDYPEGSTSLCCEHGALVTALREAAASHPNVRLLAPARVTAIQGEELHYETEGRPGTSSLRAGLIVGADGRSSVARRALGLDESRRHFYSAMAGLLLEDAELPFEGYGHVVFGGPGPILAFRLGPRQIRVCVDVPLGPDGRRPSAERLWQDYGPALPEPTREAFGRALRTQPIAWNANQRCPRTHYGGERLALVGDAVGHFHPLTATGLTVGFLDAECLAASRSVAEYGRLRSRDSYVPEVLALVFYDLLMREDRGSRALLHGMYTIWRRAARERERAVALLSGGSLSPGAFGSAYLSAVDAAVRNLVRENAASRTWRRLPADLLGLGAWLRWPVVCAWQGLSRSAAP